VSATDVRKKQHEQDERAGTGDEPGPLRKDDGSKCDALEVLKCGFCG